MIQPFQSGDRFLGDVETAREAPDSLHIWWLGQSGFLVQHQGKHLLLDPYLSDSLTRKYAETDKPHTRMTARVVPPGRLTFVDGVTSSHNHTDHLDAETLRPILRANPAVQLLVPEANREFAARRLGVEPARLETLDAGQTRSLAGFALTAVPAAHETVEEDERGKHRFLGYVAELGPWTVYHSGDTLLYDGMVDRLRRWKIDVALLPINGRKPERRVAGNLSGSQAARLAKEIGAGLVVPCHFEMFDFNTESPTEFIAACNDLEQPSRVLRAGERLTLDSAIHPSE